jgi:hypothetical protein
MERAACSSLVAAAGVTALSDGETRTKRRSQPRYRWRWVYMGGGDWPGRGPARPDE